MEHVIKTFEGAVAKLGGEHPYVKAYESLRDFAETQPDIVAYAKLRIICTALNDGWAPKFTKEEKRWYPWFYNTKNTLSCCGVAACSYADGFVCPSSIYAPSCSAHLCTCLCFKSKSLADYCGNQFIDLWVVSLMRSGSAK